MYNEVDRAISDGVCVDTRFIKESVVDDDGDFGILFERGDLYEDSFSSSLDSKAKLVEDDARSNPRLLLDTLKNKITCVYIGVPLSGLLLFYKDTLLSILTIVSHEQSAISQQARTLK